MAVPKKRTGHSAQGKRRSNWKAVKPALTTCPNCGQKVLAHTVCTACGTYKGKVVSQKGQVETVVEEKQEEVKETKKRTRKSTKKVEAAPAVEEVKAEETAEDAKVEETASEDKAE